MESGVNGGHQHLPIYHHDYLGSSTSTSLPTPPIAWSNSLGIPSLGSPPFQHSGLGHSIAASAAASQNSHLYHHFASAPNQPTWQLDHAPSWQPQHQLDTSSFHTSNNSHVNSTASSTSLVNGPSARSLGIDSSESSSNRQAAQHDSTAVSTLSAQQPSNSSFLSPLPISNTILSPGPPIASLLSPGAGISGLPVTSDENNFSLIDSHTQSNAPHLVTTPAIAYGAGASTEFGFLDLMGSPMAHDDHGFMGGDSEGFDGTGSSITHGLSGDLPPGDAGVEEDASSSEDEDDQDEDDEDEDASGSEQEISDHDYRATGGHSGFADNTSHLVDAAVRAANNSTNNNQGDRSGPTSAVNSPIYSSLGAVGPSTSVASGSTAFQFHPAGYAFSSQHLQQHPSIVSHQQNHRNFDADSAASSSTRSQGCGYFDDDEPATSLGRCGTGHLAMGMDDTNTPPTSNSSDHGTGTTHNSPYPIEQLSGAPSQFLYNPPAPPPVHLGAINGSRPGLHAHVKLEDLEDQTSRTKLNAPQQTEEVFIPALSHPRSAHLSKAYNAHDRETDAILRAADPDFDAYNGNAVASGSGAGHGSFAGSGINGGGGNRGNNRKRKRAATAGDDASLAYDLDETTRTGRTHSTDRKYSAHEQSATRYDSPSCAVGGKGKGKGRGSVDGYSEASTNGSSTVKKKKKTVNSNLGPSTSLLNSNGTVRKRTEIPAVEDDPTIKPYGCNFPHCPSLVAHQEAERQQQLDADNDVDHGEDTTSRPLPPISWRTVRELREHCAEHKRDGLEGGSLPFRCALDPCGKTFKSLAGLRFHFQNASANGHFFVSHEEGEAEPSKKFKACVQPIERSEKCPVPGCTKAFKQAAGLAYHLAHTEGHNMTEREVSTFAATLQSKTRWWYAKLGRQLL